MSLTVTQIQLIVEPFHRMFSLDNISIQYPHADVERVSVGMLSPMGSTRALELTTTQYGTLDTPLSSLFVYLSSGL